MLTDPSKTAIFSRLAAMLILVAFVLRIYHLDYQSLWRDEVDAIRFSSGPFLAFDSYQATLNILTQPGHNGPLYFIFLHGWRALAGDSEFALRYFSLLAGVLMVALTYRLAYQFKLPRTVAILAALLVTTSPYLIWYAQEAKMYTWLASLILMAVYAYQAALRAKKPGRWWALFVVMTSLSFYTHILAPLMLVIYTLWGGMQWSQLKSRLGGWCGSMSLLIGPYFPLFLWQMPLLLNRHDSGHPFYPFLQQMSLLLHLYSTGVLRLRFSLYAIWLTACLGLVGLMGGFLGATTAVRGVQTRQRLQLGAWVVIPPLLVYLVSLRVTVFEDRYLIYILPAYYLLIALGLVRVAERTRLIGGSLLLFMVIFNLRGGWHQTSQIIKADFRAAAHYIAHPTSDNAVAGQAGQMQPPTEPNTSPHFRYYLPLIATSTAVSPTIVFQMPYLQHTFGYYFSQPYRSIDGIWTNDQRDPEAVAQEMAALTSGLQTLWLVAAEEDYWDQRHLVREWLNQHGVLADEAQFEGVAVYFYRLEGAVRSKE